MSVNDIAQHSRHKIMPCDCGKVEHAPSWLADTDPQPFPLLAPFRNPPLVLVWRGFQRRWCSGAVSGFTLTSFKTRTLSVERATETDFDLPPPPQANTLLGRLIHKRHGLVENNSNDGEFVQGTHEVLDNLPPPGHKEIME